MVTTEAMPENFVLHQNYPNPFNPVTEIRYAIPGDAQVTLDMYSIRGTRVATLVDDHQAAGSYTLHWSAADLASGIYLCVLRAGHLTAVRKMVLLK